MTAQVLLFDVFCEKDPHLKVVDINYESLGETESIGLVMNF